MFSKRVTVEAWLRRVLVERCLSPTTERAYKCAVKALLKWGGPMTVQQAANRLSEFIASRSKTGSSYTASFYRRTLLTILRAAEEAGLCVMPRKVRPVKIAAHEPLGFSDLEIRLLLCFADPWQRAAILLVRCGACRRGDVFRVTWREVSADGTLRWTMRKCGETHGVVLWPEVIEACEQIRRPGDKRLVPWDSTTWDLRWHRLGRRAGVQTHRRGLQAIRRTAASLVCKEHSESEAARLLGHSTASGVSVFRRFYRVAELCDKPPVSPPKPF